MVVALVITVAAILPYFVGKVSAAGQLTTRSIKMSDATPTKVSNTYLVSFTTVGNVQSVIIDFCADSPIIGLSTCTTPTGLTVVGTTIANLTGGSLGTVTTTGTTQYQLHVNGTAAITGPQAVSFEVVGVTNPTAVGSFYARIYTYSGSSASYVSFANPGTTVDAGGIALTTANVITITARVQETLTFCVSAAVLAPTSTCTSATNPNSIVLGHGTPAVLDSTVTDTASVYTQVSTNANTGVTIRMKSQNSCSNGGLSSSGGAVCNIPGVPTTSGSVSQAITPGTAAFGLYVANSAANTAGTGTVVPDANYHHASHVTIPSDLFYGMDQTAVVGVTGTYGDVIAASATPMSLVNNELVFAATASLTTQAGVYTVNESLIATGSF
jgi:hypothetical protein